MDIKIEPVPHYSTVFDVLDALRLRPGLFVSLGSPAEALRDIFFTLNGFQTACDSHGIVSENLPTWSHFGWWFNWNIKHGSLVWIDKMLDAYPDDSTETALTRFFSYVDQFRQLRPHLVASLTLQPHHSHYNLTSTYGSGSHPASPQRIELFRYAPDAFFYSREWHALQVVEGWLERDFKRVLTRAEASYRIVRTEWEWHDSSAAVEVHRVD